MRLKCYTAPSMTEAMALVRQELGDDAFIVSTQRGTDEQGVRVTVAIEEAVADDEIHLALSGEAPSSTIEVIRDCLSFHGVPPRLTDKLTAAAQSLDVENPTMACAGALDALFVYAPFPEKKAPIPFMLLGPPGSGKTIAVAKLAARARMAGRTVGVVSADSVRAGALEQISAFTKILSVDLRKARTPHALREEIASLGPVCDIVLIDTPGLNPFRSEDMRLLKDLIAAAAVEPVLVLAAGGDPIEAAEIGEAFAHAGASRILATRLDITRRLGAILAAADSGRFMFCDVSITPHVADGLCPITPISMARLLVPPPEDPRGAEPPPAPKKRRGDAPPSTRDVRLASEPEPRPFFTALRRLDAADAKRLNETHR